MPSSGSHLKKPISKLQSYKIDIALADLERAQNVYQRTVVEALKTASTREVAAYAKISPNTLQAWKKKHA